MNKLSLLGGTKSKIVTLLLERERTASEVAKSLDIQVSAARKHLETMAELEIVDYKYVTNGVGRPKKVFTLNGSELLPNQYSNILNGLISKMLQDGNSGQVERLLEQVADEIGQSIREDIRSARETKDISEALDKYGFRTTVEKTQDKALVITCRNCPMLDIAAKHKELICDHIHDQILRTAFETPHVERKKCAAVGDRLCLHIVHAT